MEGRRAEDIATQRILNTLPFFFLIIQAKKKKKKKKVNTLPFFFSELSQKSYRRTEKDKTNLKLSFLYAITIVCYSRKQTKR